MVRTVSGQPGRIPGSEGPASPAGRRGLARGAVPGGRGARQRAAVFIRRHHLTPYALLLPSAVAIGLLLFWPTIQIFFLFVQRRMTTGLVAGAVKG